MVGKSKNRSKSDFDKYLNDIEKNRSLIAIMKGHLIIESLLDELLECGLKHPEKKL